MLMRTEEGPHDASAAADAVVARLFIEHGHLLKRYLFRICREQDKVDDLVQEAFIRLRQTLSRATTAPVRNPIGLLYKIAERVLIDQLRREKVRGRRSEESLETLESHLPDPAMDLDEWVYRTEALKLCEEIVSALPDEQRRAVQLRVEGLKPGDIATEMNISVARVYRLLQLASERCQRKWLELDLFYDDGTP